jgi:two-component system sensor histidine kinase KdpD
VFSVADRGPGLPPGPPEQLFEPFFRSVAADRADPGGSGLGLSIVRQIVRAHGGKVAACPRRGRGAVFFIVLPAGSGP